MPYVMSSGHVQVVSICRQGFSYWVLSNQCSSAVFARGHEGYWIWIGQQDGLFMFLLPTRSYQPVSLAFSLLQLRLSNFSKIFGWAELDNALGIFFVLEGGFYGGNNPPPKKKTAIQPTTNRGILALLDLVGFQWCHLQRRTFPRNRAEPDDLGNLERMEWAPTYPIKLHFNKPLVFRCYCYFFVGDLLT